MKKILFIVENELLAQLYRTNFSVYLDTQVFWVNSYEQFLKELKKDFSFDLIVSQTAVNNFDIIHEIIKLINENKISIPVLAIGMMKEEDARVVNVKESLNIQQLLSSAAKILGITAQMMANIQVPEFYPIDIEFIIYLKKAPTNLYIEMDSEFMQFANKDVSIVDLIKNLRKEGITKIYVKSIERLEVVAKITEILKAGLIESHGLNTVQKSEVVNSGFDFFVDNFVSPEAAQEIVHTANVCSRVMADVVEESPDMQSLFAIFKNSRNNYLYIHTMLTVYVATHIIRNVQWGGENQIEKLNFVIFFHDLMLAPIYAKYPHLQGEESLLSSEDLLRSEKQLVMNHARLGAEAIGLLKKCPIGSDQLIKQHHGINTGIGFATEFKDDISPIAKVIIIAESFVDEFMYFKESNAHQKLDMVEIIHKLNDKFKKNSYKKIVETLLTLKI